jgi:hypothetical protein
LFGARMRTRRSPHSKERPGREILIFGSHLLWNHLLATGLIDKLHFMIGAGVVGAGVRAFETRPHGRLRLLDIRALRPETWTLAHASEAACVNQSPTSLSPKRTAAFEQRSGRVHRRRSAPIFKASRDN